MACSNFRSDFNFKSNRAIVWVSPVMEVPPSRVCQKMLPQFFKFEIARKKLLYLFMFYVVQQFNFWNSLVKTKICYCRLKNTLLVMPCTSSDDGATAGNSLEYLYMLQPCQQLHCCTSCLIICYCEYYIIYYIIFLIKIDWLIKLKIAFNCFNIIKIKIFVWSKQLC
jgi:hypothetical protein